MLLNENDPVTKVAIVRACMYFYMYLLADHYSYISKDDCRLL